MKTSRATDGLTWYLFSSIEGEPRYRSENAEAGRDQKQKEGRMLFLDQ